MPSNKNKSNAFHYFMLDYKKREEEKGRIFDSMKDVQADPKLHKAWQNLTKAEKSMYIEKEKNSHLKPSLIKRNNLGESIQERAEIEKREKNFYESMKQYLSGVLKEGTLNCSAHKLKFYVIHVNYYCIYDFDTDFKYSPAEIALVEFSLERGITRSYCKIINSEIRVGYAHEVSMHSKSTHQIPKEPDFGETNYAQIFQEICEFIKPGKENGRLPPLFTLYTNEILKKSVISVVDYLASFSEKLTYNFLVYSFEELFASLYNNFKDTSVNAVDEAIVSLQLKKDPFDYKISLCCEYHQTGAGSNFCSKSIVQRWVFVLFSHVCSLANIKLVPGKHLPIDNAETNDNKILNESFAALRVPGGEQASKASSKSNARNTVEDVRRQQSKPIQITFHGSFGDDSTDSLTTSCEPSTSSSIEHNQSDGSTGLNLRSENHFPAIGRGAVIKKYNQKVKSSKGHTS